MPYSAKKRSTSSRLYSAVSSMSPKLMTSPAYYVSYLPCMASTSSYQPAA